MNKLKIPENHSGVSKTLRLPEDIVEDIQNLANIKNLSFNKTITSLLEFSLNNLDEVDKSALTNLKNQWNFIWGEGCPSSLFSFYYHYLNIMLVYFFRLQVYKLDLNL